MPANDSERKGRQEKHILRYFGIDGLDTSVEYEEGFVQIPNIVLRYLNRLGLNGSKASLAILLIYLMSRDFNGKGYSFPSHKLIAKDIDSSPGTVGRNLKKLKDMGLIEIKLRRTNNGQTTNHYSWDGLKTKLRELMTKDGMIK